MPLIRPFRALRYGSDHLDSLGEMISPAILGEPEDRRIVGDVHEHCVRQLVRGDRGPLALASEPPFTHAARLLARWKEEGVVVRDPRPSLYTYEQRFEEQVHRGMVACVRLGLEDEPVLAHEATRGRTTGLLRDGLAAMQTQLSMVVGFVEDRQGALQEHLAGGEGRPHLVVEDGEGWLNRVWRDEDPALQLRMAEALRGEVTVVADGHHRLEAAQAFQAEQQARGGRRERPSDYVMMLLVPVSEAETRSRPTHRVCPILNEEARAIVAGLEASFVLTDFGADDEALLQYLQDPSSEHRFGLVQTGRRWGMSLREGATPPPGAQEASELLSAVDASVLDRWVIGPIEEALGGGFASLTETGSSGNPFSHNRSSCREILKMVDAGEAELAFLLRPAPPSQVLAVARAGEMMPLKSTNFWPKPAKGLLMNSLMSF